jgi:hypothetical protein
MGRQGDAKGSGGAGFRQAAPSGSGSGESAAGKRPRRGSSQVIPDAVSQRMASLCGEGLADLDYSAVARPYL